MKYKELITAIKAHAMDNYENGYSFVVEAMTDDDIYADIDDMGWTTLDDATAFYDRVIDARGECTPMAGYDY